MSFFQPDPNNAPPLSIGQQFEIFIKKGGNLGGFALETMQRTSNKIFAIEAHPLEGGAITFLGGMIRMDREPELAKLMIEKINKTQEILTGKKPSIPESGMEVNLGQNYIGNY